MNSKSYYIAIGLSLMCLAGCGEKKPELKTVDYWEQNRQEMMDFWLNQCRTKIGLQDVSNDCLVVHELVGTPDNENFSDDARSSAQDAYDSILREKQRGR